MDGMVQAQEDILENIESLKGRDYTKAVHDAATYSGLLRMCSGILNMGMSADSQSPDHLFKDIIAIILVAKYEEAIKNRPESTMTEFSNDVHSLQRHVCAHITRGEDDA